MASHITPNPEEWPEGHVPKYQVVNKVDVIYLNINAASDFNKLRTGTNDSVHEAITQVTKHVQRGLYRVVSMNASERSCVVVISTKRSRDELVWKNGFPWDLPEDPQPDIVL